MKIFLENEPGHEKALAKHLEAIDAAKADAPAADTDAKVKATPADAAAAAKKA